ncbi:YcaO-like family protein [bacterium]|nr:YcaO-like family protein [bacterium]
MADDSDTVTFRLGTHRTVPPEHTLERVMPHMSAMGITRIADVTGLDRTGIPVVMVCRPNSRSVSLSQGKGHTIAAARASGLMESVEGYHAEHMIQPLHIASMRDMDNIARTVAVNRLPRIKGSQFHRDHPITWVEAEDLLSGLAFWLPYEMVHTNYTYPRPSGSGCFPASSNGLASGNTINEATIHGICEVIERDSIALWYQLGSAALDKTSINLDTIDSPYCLAIITRLNAAEISTYIWDITSDSRIPSYMSVIVDQASSTQHVGVGSGTHLCKEVALLRALHEAVQVRTTYIVGARDDIRPEEYTIQGMMAKRKHFEKLISRCTFKTDYSKTLDLHSTSITVDVESLLSHLQAIEIDQVFRVELTRPEFNIPVVRIVVPGLEAPHDEDNYIPGQRALKVRQSSRQ